MKLLAVLLLMGLVGSAEAKAYKIEHIKDPANTLVYAKFGNCTVGYDSTKAKAELVDKMIETSFSTNDECFGSSHAGRTWTFVSSNGWYVMIMRLKKTETFDENATINESQVSNPAWAASRITGCRATFAIKDYTGNMVLFRSNIEPRPGAICDLTGSVQPPLGN